MGTPTDTEQIQRLLGRYSTTCDDGEFDVFATCFTADAEFEVLGTVQRGRDEIAAFMALSLPPERRGRHITSNIVIDLHPSGDGASGTVDFMFVTGTSGAFAILTVGRYLDQYIRDADGEWRIRRREITFFGGDPTG